MSAGDTELARDLGFLEAYTLGLGTMIGAGIFVLPGIVAEAAGPASMISFVIGGVVALLAALSLSELATGMPKAGGSYYYVNHALGSFFGTIVGWGMWAGLMFATAFYMLGFGQYLLNQPSTALGVVVAGLIMAALLVLLNYRGVKETGSFQNVVVIALLGLIIAFVAFGLPQIDPELFTPFTAGEGWAAVGATAGTVFVTFIGFEVIATSAEEIKKPGRNLPLSMIAAVVTPTILYVLVMLVSTGVLPVPDLAASDVPVSDVARATVGTLGTVTIAGFTVEIAVIGGGLMTIGAILATISSANASILSAARVNFAMGRDKVLTDWLNDIHERYRTPYRAILATGAVILALIFSQYLFEFISIAFLADVAAFMFLITYALVHVAVVVLRRAEPEGYDPDFRIPTGLYPAVPILGLVACLGVMVQMPSAVQLTSLGIVVLGIVWYVFYAREKAISTTLIGEAVAPREEPRQEEDLYRVVVPVSNPETQRTLIRYAAASAADRERNAELIAVNVIEVPPQTSPAQVEEVRVRRQQELLENARAVADDLDVPVRTRELVGRSASNAILSVLEEEAADHVLLGWAGERRRRDVLFGTTIDPILERAPCEVTLVKDPAATLGGVVVLAGTGAHTPTSVRRATEFTRADPDSTLTLLNVQPKPDPDDEMDPEAAGLEIVRKLAEEAGLAEDEYEAAVDVVSGEAVRETLVERAIPFDTICLGATGTSTVAQALYGSIPQHIVRRSGGTVVMSRGEQRAPRTLRQALIQRLEAQ